MLTKLSMTNFKSVRSDVMNFGPGLQVWRGRNEAGKSTRLHAIMYALYGAKALNLPLDDIVTWGEKVSTLKVEAELFIGGRNYRFVRSKGGAEVYVDDASSPYVTGQNEVTAFASDLLGADANTATALMLVNQGEIRGTLTKGSKATTEMIESLADFDLFETLIERMSENLMLGSDVSARERLEQARQALEAADVKAPDVAGYKRQIDALTTESQSIQVQLEKVAEPALKNAQVATAMAKQQKVTYENLERAVEKERTQLATLKVALEKNRQLASVEIDEDRILQLDREVEGVENARVAVEALKAFRALPTDCDEWEGNMESLDEEISKTENAKALLEQTKFECESERRNLQAKIITDTNCPTCGQPLKDHDKIEAQNQSLKDQINGLSKKLTETAGQLTETVDYLAALKSVRVSARPFETFLRTYGTFVHVNLEQVPPQITWKGDEPKLPDVKALKAELDELLKNKRLKAEASAKVVSLGETVEYTEAQYLSLKSSLENESAPPDLAALRQAETEADQEVTRLRLELSQISSQISDLRVRLEREKAEYESAQRGVEQLKAQVAEAEAEVQELAFNNALLKKIRAARPIIGDKLWSMVLGAVSTMFSKMRGEQSVITKGKDGFLCNGEVIGGLSGSTLDALALAIRVALIRTFIPNCPFITLDEPFAAADDDRAAKMLGFIQGAGFPQTILVTHESISEAAGDNLILLGD